MADQEYTINPDDLSNNTQQLSGTIYDTYDKNLYLRKISTIPLTKDNIIDQAATEITNIVQGAITNNTTIQTIISTTSGGSPGGSNKELQFNDGGTFAGVQFDSNSAMSWNKTTGVLTLHGDGSFQIFGDNAPASSVSDGQGIVFTGGTGDGSADGGFISINGGTGGSSGQGGGVELVAGNAGATGDTGGHATIQSGWCTEGDAGIVSLVGGNSTNYNGGYITFAPGTGNATSGKDGYVSILDGRGNYYSFRSVGHITTTNNTPTNAHRAQVPTMAANSSMIIRANVIARRTGGSSGAAGDSAFYQMVALTKKIGAGAPTIAYQNAIESFEDQVGWDCVFAISGDDVTLTVTGATNNNITWAFELCYVIA